jgi:hypothetical protein
LPSQDLYSPHKLPNSNMDPTAIAIAAHHSRSCYLSVRWRALFVLPVACSLCGCGNGLASVTGMVTLDGQPIAGGSDVHAMVCFTPEGGGPPGIGTIDAAGHYSISTGSAGGIRPGKYLVAVSATKLIPSGVPGMPGGGRPITPSKYANPKESGFEVDIQPGSNGLDFKLVSGTAR